MKPYNILFCIIAILVVASCSEHKTISVSVMTWNIWHGGLHGDQASEFEQDTSNTLNVLKVIQEENPDIIFMQETYCCGMDIAKEAGYTYSWRGSSNLSIHSKYPIIDTLKLYKPFNSHGVVIDVEGDKLLCINLWLHYLPDYFQDIKQYSPDSLIQGEQATRLNEIKAITKAVDSLVQKLDMPIIIGGDFNSGSHLDWVESTKEAHYDKIVVWPVSKLMADRGYIDSFRELNPDLSSTLQGTWGYLNEDIISDRIDYIYYKGEGIKAIASGIVMDNPTGGFFNSDHRAILTYFEIKK